MAVVFADEPGALRDQKKPTTDRVVDILGHLRNHRAGQVGVKGGDQCRRYHGTRHELVRAAGPLQALRRVDRLVNACIDKGQLLRLAVLDCKIITGGYLRSGFVRRQGCAIFDYTVRGGSNRGRRFCRDGEEHDGGGGLVSLSATALGVWVSGRRYPALLEHRSPEITGQWRSELRNR